MVQLWCNIMNIQDEMQKTIGLCDENNHDDDNIWGKVCRIMRALTNTSYCYPSLANGILLTANESSWTPSDYIEVIPVNTITSDYRLHDIIVENTSNGGCYQLDFYKGTIGNEVHIGSVRISGISEIKGNRDIRTKCLEANNRVSCKVSHNIGGETITISLGYHLV